MDISPEPSRMIASFISCRELGHLFEKVTRAHAFTTSMRLFGRDLINGTPFSPASRSQVNPNRAISYKANPITKDRPYTFSSLHRSTRIPSLQKHVYDQSSPPAIWDDLPAYLTETGCTWPLPRWHD
jgi:hypothetical protein